MLYEVLARKWRPQIFQDVIGQDHVTQTLMNAIKSGRLAHAFLFGGPRGVGKTSVARILAKAMNCEQGEPGIPCNKCSSCVEITEGSSVDVQEIDGASNRGIDEIRELRENVKYMSSSSRYRIYIIDEVHMLTLPAFNALLKTLEEPPAHVKFIFATTETSKVPVTILSRCQRYDFKRIPPAQIADHLESITKKEDIEISKTALALIARTADGSMRDGQSLMDQVISFTGNKVEDRQVIEILGIIDKDILFNASRAIIEGSPLKCLEIIEEIYNYGYDIKEFYRALMDQFRNLLVSVLVPEANLLDMNEKEKAEANRQANSAGTEKIQIILNFLISREQVLRFSSHPRLFLEAIMIKLCHLGDFLSFGDLIEKIGSLEKRLITASSGQQAKGHGISDPGAGWGSKHKGKSPTDSGGESASDQKWGDFLAFLTSKNRIMANILKDWNLLKLSEKAIKIEGGNQSFSSTYFDDKERYDQLIEYCKEFFQTDIRVMLVSNSNPSLHQKKDKNAGSTIPESRAEKHSDLAQPVQDVLNMFQGEIITGDPAKVTGTRPVKAMKTKEEAPK